MNVKIEIIPHSAHRYPTVGDWLFEDGDLVIRVSKLSSWRLEMLVAVHELVESLICKDRRISQKQVDDFDKIFENKRKQGLHTDDEEPGDDPDAPYVNPHCLATGIERILAAELDVSWKEYEEELNKLP